jgi:adenylate cyclase
MIFNSKNIFIAIFLNLIFLVSVDAQNSEQGLPFIQNISPHESGFKGENYSIAQDGRQIMYFGNFNGLLEYDGNSWELIPVNGNPILTKDSHGNIFVGAFNQIYTIAHDSRGKLKLVSLLDSANFGQIKSIIVEGNKILFTTQTNLFVYDQNLQRLFNDPAFIHLFKLEKRLLINSPDLGLVECNFKKVIILPESKAFITKEILGIVPLKNGYLAVTSTGVFKVIHGVVTQINTLLSDLLQGGNYICNTVLSNKGVAIGTKNKGIIIIDQEGEITSIIDKNCGLYDNQINDLLVDESNSLWAAFSNGVARIETPSAYSYFDYNSGIGGNVNTILRFKGLLYVGTSDGLYVKKKRLPSALNGKKFEKYATISGECKKLLEVNNQLLASTSSGLYVIDKNPILILSDQTNTIQKSEYKKDVLFVSTANAIFSLQYKNGKWTILGGLKGFKSKVTSIAISNEGMIWVGTLNEGVFKIQFSNLTLIDAKITQFKKGNGLPSGSYWIDSYNSLKGVVFSTDSGLYRFNYVKNIFTKDSLIAFPKESKSMRVNPFIEDIDKNIWMSFEKENTSQKPILVAWNLPNVKQYTCISQPFNRVRDFICETIYPDTNLSVWFGGFNGLVRLDFKSLRESTSSVHTLIRRVTINRDSVLCENTEYNSIFSKSFTALSYRNRNISFNFTTPLYQKNNETLYQTKLEGFDKDWSEFSESTSKEYTNLNPGDYVFKVRSKDLFENISHEAIFKFTIKKPFFRTYYALFLCLLLLINAIMVLLNWRSYQFSKKEIRLNQLIDEKTEEYLNEKEKTESILANILPEKTVRELKDKDKASSVRFKMATVLFSDIQGFTKIAEVMSPDVLVDELDKLFIQFDKIIEKYNIEKIKTIGDAYMCAGGIPQKNRTNPIDVVLAALEMQNFIQEQQLKAESEGSTYWGLRIGVHTGPVVAGVIGKKKFTYDIWGDTVNIANRMETAGEGNMVNISEDTFLLINEFFDCVHRGKMPIKYKGEVDMYFVKGLKAEFSSDEQGMIPNREMRNKLNLLQFEDLEEFMFDKLQDELPKHLFYHNVKHTIDVVVHTEILAIEENVTSEELLLLKTASLFHDSGFLIDMKNHEVNSVKMAEEILPQFGYSKEQRAVVAELIMATQMPQKPKNHLQEIMCDADLDYLGRPDYLNVSRNLFRELIGLNLIKESEYDWNKLQLKFLQEHQYFTESAKKRRNQSKNKQLMKIIEQDYKFESDKLKEEKL